MRYRRRNPSASGGQVDYASDGSFRPVKARGGGVSGVWESLPPGVRAGLVGLSVVGGAWLIGYLSAPEPPLAPPPPSDGP